MMKSSHTAVAGKVDKFFGVANDRQIWVIASDGSTDRMGDILEPWGAELDDFRRNPICLAQHDVNRPVARCTSIKVDRDKIPALIEFPAEGVSEIADEYCRLYKSGILSAVSVGFVPIDWQPLPRGGRRYTSWTLLELSLVSLPEIPMPWSSNARSAGAAALTPFPGLKCGKLPIVGSDGLASRN
jgi:hypothetical protein